MLEYFKNDTFHYTVAAQFPDANYVEYYNGTVTESNPVAKQKIVYFVDEVARTFKEPNNELKLHYFTFQPIDIDQIIQKYVKTKEQYFTPDIALIPEENYNLLKGSSWPSYNEYVGGNWNSVVADEIRQFEKEFQKDEFTIIKENFGPAIDYINATNCFVKSLDVNQTIVITASKIIYDFFKRLGFKTIFLDVMHDALGDFLNVKRLQHCFVNNKKPTFNYYCLNRRFAPYREKIIAELHQLDLLKHGYVTQHAFPYNVDYLKTKYPLVQYSEDLSAFNSANSGHFKNHNYHNGVYFSNSVKNLMHINNNIKSKIALVSETAICEWFVTEKSFQPLFCKRIPLIIACKGVNQFLSNQGFDMFSDIVDYQFDSIDDEDLKIQTAIRNNKEILKSLEINNDFKSRLEQNKNYLIDGWVPQKISNLVTEIKSLL